MMDPSTRVVVPTEVLFRELGGESVLLNLRSECYFGLDAVGTRMWQALVEGGSIATALAALGDRYDVEADTLARDLGNLVASLVDHGLLRIDPA